MSDVGVPVRDERGQFEDSARERRAHAVNRAYWAGRYAVGNAVVRVLSPDHPATSVRETLPEPTYATEGERVQWCAGRDEAARQAVPYLGDAARL